MPRPRPARTRILTAADTLFYAHGTAATGIDSVTAHADVARKSLYNNFPSKEALITAWLEQRHADWLDYYAVRLEATAGSTGHPALAVFDAYLDHANAAGDEFRGCGLLNTAAEYPAGSPVRETVRRHKEQIEQIFAGSAPDRAEMLSYLIEGAVTRAGLDGTPERLHHARAMAAELLSRPDHPAAAQ